MAAVGLGYLLASSVLVRVVLASCLWMWKLRFKDFNLSKVIVYVLVEPGFESGPYYVAWGNVTNFSVPFIYFFFSFLFCRRV